MESQGQEVEKEKHYPYIWHQKPLAEELADVRKEMGYSKFSADVQPLAEALLDACESGLQDKVEVALEAAHSTGFFVSTGKNI